MKKAPFTLSLPEITPEIYKAFALLELTNNAGWAPLLISSPIILTAEFKMPVLLLLIYNGVDIRL